MPPSNTPLLATAPKPRRGKLLIWITADRLATLSSCRLLSSHPLFPQAGHVACMHAAGVGGPTGQAPACATVETQGHRAFACAQVMHSPQHSAQSCMSPEPTNRRAWGRRERGWGWVPGAVQCGRQGKLWQGPAVLPHVSPWLSRVGGLIP